VIFQVRNWFEENKQDLRIKDSGLNRRQDSKELILPFFEKEPDWSKFHIYQWPDGRQVYEVNLANIELVFPTYLADSLKNIEPNKVVIQNIMFVENQETGRFDPVIARYYPDNENSIRNFDEIYFNKIDFDWSGTVDIWTYDERHFIGFIIREGQMVSNVRFDTGIDEGAKIIAGHNYLTVDCYRVPTITTYTYTTTGYYETEVTATQHYATFCSGGGGAAPGYGNDTGTSYNYGGTYEYGGTGSYGSTGETTYTPPAIIAPQIINQLTNPCASGNISELKKRN
jgi:hypothetical protein